MKRSWGIAVSPSRGSGDELLQHLLAVHHVVLARRLRQLDHQRRGDEQVVGHDALGLVVHCAGIAAEHRVIHQDEVRVLLLLPLWNV